MAKRRCAWPRCPTLVDPKAYRGLCDTHRKQRDRDRGSRQDRGYGVEHQRLKRELEAQVASGQMVICCRCDLPITPGQQMHPDHSPDRAVYLGPAHAACNLRAAGHASHL